MVSYHGGLRTLSGRAEKSKDNSKDRGQNWKIAVSSSFPRLLQRIRHQASSLSCCSPLTIIYWYYLDDPTCGFSPRCICLLFFFLSFSFSDSGSFSFFVLSILSAQILQCKKLTQNPVTRELPRKKGARQRKSNNVNKHPTAMTPTSPTCKNGPVSSDHGLWWPPTNTLWLARSTQKEYPQAARTPRTLRIYGRSSSM